MEVIMEREQGGEAAQTTTPALLKGLCQPIPKIQNVKDRALSWRRPLKIANQILESTHTIVRRYYFERKEGLTVKSRTQHAASTIPVSAARGYLPLLRFQA
jgi:hypothetical protein